MKPKKSAKDRKRKTLKWMFYKVLIKLIEQQQQKKKTTKNLFLRDNLGLSGGFLKFLSSFQIYTTLKHIAHLKSKCQVLYFFKHCLNSSIPSKLNNLKQTKKKSIVFLRDPLVFQLNCVHTQIHDKSTPEIRLQLQHFPPCKLTDMQKLFHSKCESYFDCLSCLTPLLWGMPVFMVVTSSLDLHCVMIRRDHATTET